MKTLILNLWKCRMEVLKAFLFFFILSLVVDSPYMVLTKGLISLGFALFVVIMGIKLVKIY